MREILFRAKREDNGEWAYGYYVRLPDAAGSASMIHTPARNPDESNSSHFIRSSTIGQFTGLTDKNGTRIFEGDVITFEDVCCEGGSGYEYPDEWAVEAMNRVEVIIRNGCVCFGKELFESNAYEDIQFYYPNLNEWFAECAEIIGNIYDNPELIGGTENDT